MAEEFGCLDLVVEDDFFFDFDPSVISESPTAEDFIRVSPDSGSSWIGEIESQLMNDDNHEQQDFPELDQQSVSDFLADILVDYSTSDSGPVDFAAAKVSDVPTVYSPAGGSNSGEFATGKVLAGSNDSKKENADFLVEKKSDASNDSGSESQDDAKVESQLERNDDAVAKKRRRRQRNRDAAVRSRERKKELVKDLETKSKYLERECLRLGRMLECVVAENQSLRLCLQKGGNDASMTKQESAVLLLESLLLGSLLWYLGDIICQFPQPRTENRFLSVETEEPEKLVQSGRESSNIVCNTGKSRRCKGSRPRMKHQILKLVA